MSEEILVWLILLPPFIGCLITPIINKIKASLVPVTSVLVLLVSGISASIAFIQNLSGDWNTYHNSTTWIEFKSLANIELSINADPLSIFMAFVASFLGLLIAAFSLEYMSEDKSKLQYWFFIQLFIGSMNMLVLAGDFLLLFFGWELVGLCSFMLIGHFSYKPGEDGLKARLSGIKAFLFTNLADSGFFLAIVVMYKEYGSFDFAIIKNANPSTANNLIAIGLVVAAFGKSAQFPFIPWLSSPDRVDIDAMQGPTTVSALIHAATMVKAGVYLVSRVYLVVNIKPSEGFYWFIIVIAGGTALITALSALTSVGIKRILAYSTVSQLAYMFMSLGIAFAALEDEQELSIQAFNYAQFHLLSHAIFKSLLFLSAGYIIHIYHDKKITSLKGVAHWDKNPILAAGIISGSLALSGIPPFMGFFSKESIISVSYELGFEHDSSIGKTAYVLALLTAIITALYCARFIYYLIFADSEQEETTKDDQSIFMKGVIAVLSVFAVIGGLFGFKLFDYFEEVHGGVETEGLGLFVSHSILNALIIISALALSFYSLLNYQTSITRIQSFWLIKWITTISAEGFYLDDIWQLGWIFTKSWVYKIRRLHTGDLNWTIGLIGIVTITVIGTIIGGVDL
ncbi:MAG: NADH-quinone oxidoreductase subunit L [Candidatus Heimdallarchaeota archaeon LC_2]|nr:MAG: NADH-quinone oxidoreductase subunit L [Candidatus Heimdallarchaeota archaeon LC_2]